MGVSLREELIWKIKSTPNRAISFRQYMEIALYHPRWGYYQKETDKLGKSGDFFTNAHVGRLFGQVLSRFFGNWLDEYGSLTDWTIVEMGAGDGRIAEQFGQGLVEMGISPDKVSFYLVETSPYHQRLQKERLFASPVNYQLVHRLSDVPASPFSFIYSNELVDAFPVHRIKKEQGKLLEAYVTLSESKPYLRETWLPLPEDKWNRGKLGQWLMQLNEGSEMALCLAARDWLREIADWMEQGVLLTIDYGGLQEQLLQKQRTIRGFRGHQVCDEFYDTPGGMDLTYDVNFTHLIEWGLEAGLAPCQFLSQFQFLMNAGILNFLPAEPVRDPFGKEAKRIRAIKQLIHPETMGEVFRVLVQTKNLPLTKMNERG
ncbi:class I SAM-dependent methyltransferase [Thermoactinomyces mirandus]|uniref:SAM-dependent methyltransferase n=1 Tax=Thermoactinomyces mirandus TaxID=2756294 RepID=A0A7W1XQ84_9BACL|nr:SAM-dependent methyltransferase [Thermoactinomyces mirandus]MBA4601186.1 SAM-dependent methyltransferase [Thermoactinomyces mirandus]